MSRPRIYEPSHLGTLGAPCRGMGDSCDSPLLCSDSNICAIPTCHTKQLTLGRLGDVCCTDGNKYCETGTCKDGGAGESHAQYCVNEDKPAEHTSWLPTELGCKNQSDIVVCKGLQASYCSNQEAGSRCGSDSDCKTQKCSKSFPDTCGYCINDPPELREKPW